MLCGASKLNTHFAKEQRNVETIKTYGKLKFKKKQKRVNR